MGNNDRWAKIRLAVYRNLKDQGWNSSEISSQCNRIIGMIKDDKSDLFKFWEKTDDNEIADFITNIFCRKTQRNLLSQLDYTGMKYNLTELCIKKPKNEESNSDQLNKKLEENDSVFNPETLIPCFVQCSKNYKKENFNEFCKTARRYNTLALGTLLTEKKIVESHSYNYLYFKRVAQYSKLTTIVLGDLLSKNLLWHVGYENSNEYINSVKQGLEFLKAFVEYAIERYKYLKPSSYSYRSENGTVDKITMTDQRYVLYYQTKCYLEEVKKINGLLENEINENPDSFQKHQSTKYLRVSDYSYNNSEQIRDFMEDESKLITKNDLLKLDESKEFIKKANKEGFELGSEEDAILLKIVFREIFNNKTKQGTNKNEDRNAMTIARNWMKKGILSNRDWIFIECKLCRGRFREIKRIELYPYYNKILLTIEEILNKVYLLPNDEIMYDVISKIFNIGVFVLSEE